MRDLTSQGGTVDPRPALTCAVCGAASAQGEGGWLALAARTPDGSKTSLVLCPDCVREELGDAEE